MNKRIFAKKAITAATLGAISLFNLTACSNAQQPAAASEPAADSNTLVAGESQPAPEEDVIVLKGIVDLVPHSEIIEYVRPQLEAQGIYI